ncbi:hypothetical protein BS47DRAFT_1388685 [Hydnum rufescens UP504]|uniref:Uncharacterized protein n=1 Tax=Hydnum rufescens UP504 TaxID=1448309 RepID=A0A9P6E110_9AGAM|nr:hypothetical protein BS47DRAFT_1388685 [Hydnum rufescens UP504]
MNNGTYGPADYAFYRQEFSTFHADTDCETRLWPFIPQGLPDIFHARQQNGQWFVTADSRSALASDWIDTWDMATDLQRATRLLIPEMARVLCYRLECPGPASAGELFSQQFAPWFHLDVLRSRFCRIYRVIQVLRGYCNYATTHRGFSRGCPAPTSSPIAFPFMLGIYWSTDIYGNFADCTLAAPYRLHLLPFYGTAEGPSELEPCTPDRQFIKSSPPPDEYLDKPLAARLIPPSEPLPSLPDFIVIEGQRKNVPPPTPGLREEGINVGSKLQPWLAEIDPRFDT